jgi:hypothetical protein
MINRMPTPNLDGNSPLKFIRPDYPLFSLYPKVFGFTCFVHILGPTRNKLGPQPQFVK